MNSQILLETKFYKVHSKCINLHKESVPAKIIVNSSDLFEALGLGYFNSVATPTKSHVTAPY